MNSMTGSLIETLDDEQVILNTKTSINNDDRRQSSFATEDLSPSNQAYTTTSGLTRKQNALASNSGLSNIS